MMATKTMRTDLEAPTPSLAEGQAAATAADAEVERLKALIRGTVDTWETRHETRQIVTRTGAIETVEVDTPVFVSREVPLGERLEAKRRLPAAELYQLECAAALEAARGRDAEAGRRAREQAVAEGVALLRRELPRILREQRRVQAEWRALQARCEALDQRLGMARFAEAGWPFVMAPGAQLDAFVACCVATYGLDLE